ncbi:conserved hypothetical protein [Methanohalobium evestigatum Z-7303]|uniref:Cytochrome c domain-containing protein n=1 Tax=Methanohalobium evestigatum (strain ATCC BAA-1072 / DSM 3721 / NBRC 107634 / OCM 161 / Z-7303) TaxID=644295 RepID=D7E924_METEZ|nr:cytochrome c [Methanohalobium evestigatum]ADI73972.1 conserved hypothetical protein [Methanohalobium evestigatum Z-7303]
MKSSTIILIIILAIVVAGSIPLLIYQLYPPNIDENSYGPTGPGRSYQDQNLKTSFESNGETIYYTGFNKSGDKIQISSGPHWVYVHGGSCVDCHGADGKGNRPIRMNYKIPPDITYSALTSDEHDEHPVYTDETIKRAIRKGIDPSGNLLDSTMPRWHMSDKDVDDVVEYLKKLDN